VVSASEVAANLVTVLDPGRALVVCTDEADPEFLVELRRRFPRLLLIDQALLEHQAWGRSFQELPRNDRHALAVVTQTVAARAETFVGTMFSTFTGAIHRARGFLGDDRQLYCYNDWPNHPGVRYQNCEFLPVREGPYSWSRLDLPLSASACSWAREWRESWSCAAAEPDGAVVLPAEAAGRLGRAFLETWSSVPHIGYWTDESDSPSWAFALAARGRYAVEIEYACSPDGGGRFGVWIDGRPRGSATCWSTNGWHTFESRRIDVELDLAAGVRVLTIRPEEICHGLMNLRRIRLVPSSSALGHRRR
jgi:hypothetical protein